VRGAGRGLAYLRTGGAGIPMSDDDYNAYLVLKKIFQVPVYKDAAFTARKEAEAVYRGDRNNMQCYEAMQKDTFRYSKHPFCAKMDDTTGLYTCYFLRHGIVMSGTTNVKPRETFMSNLFASEYGNVNDSPGTYEVHCKNKGVLWWAHPHCQ